MSRRTSTLAAAGLLVLTLLAVALLLPVPYVTMRPGPTVDVLGDYDGKPVLEIEDAKTYPTDGQIRLTTVSVTRADSRVSLPQAFIAYFNSEEAVVPRDLVYPKDQTAEESRQENAAQMASSKLTSEAAALTEAGYDVTSVVEIAAVSEDGPSAGVLEVDDVLVSVDGQKVTGTDQAVRLVSSARPGAVISALRPSTALRPELAPGGPVLAFYVGDQNVHRLGRAAQHLDGHTRDLFDKPAFLFDRAAFHHFDVIRGHGYSLFDGLLCRTGGRTRRKSYRRADARSRACRPGSAARRADARPAAPFFGHPGDRLARDGSRHAPAAFCGLAGGHGALVGLAAQGAACGSVGQRGSVRRDGHGERERRQSATWPV